MKVFYLSFAFLLTFFSLQAQLFIDTSYTAEEMVMDFFDNSCVTPSNVSFNGAPLTMAFFEGANTNLGVNAGIMLTTGDVTNAMGPNDVEGAGSAMGASGDALLSAYGAMVPTFDAAVLEMDIVATTDTLCFLYVFGSEEYEEWVGSDFNDIFAFFITGPGINDTIMGGGNTFPNTRNMAMIPGSSLPVAINNVNQDTFSSYYVNNAGGQTIQYDGFTVVLPAKAVVIPGESYHIKIAIADGSDQILDSGVFLSVESLCGDSLLKPTAGVDYVISGNKVEVTNNSKYASKFFWDYGDGTTSTERHPAPHEYTAPGVYEMKLVIENYCCKDSLIVEVEVEGTVSTRSPEVRPFTLAPNPVQDYLQIRMESGEAFSAELYNLQGQRLQRFEGRGNFNWEEAARLDPGIYLLEIRTAEGTFTERILKK